MKGKGFFRNVVIITAIPFLMLMLIASLTSAQTAEFTTIINAAVADQASFGVFSINAGDLKTALSSTASTPLVLDLRTYREYSKGHIKGAINIYWRDIAKQESLAYLDAKIAEHKSAGKKPQIVVYNNTQHEQGWIATFLNMMGYDNIANSGKKVLTLAWGLAAWTKDETIAPGRFTPAVDKNDFPTETTPHALITGQGRPVPDVPTGLSKKETIRISAERWLGKLSDPAQPLGYATPRITAQELYDILNDSNPANDPYVLSNRGKLLPANGGDGYDTGHIRGAFRVTVGKEGVTIRDKDFLPLDRLIVVHCWVGVSQQYMVPFLNMLGYNVKTMDWGMSSWSSDPVVINPAKAAPANVYKSNYATFALNITLGAPATDASTYSVGDPVTVTWKVTGNVSAQSPSSPVYINTEFVWNGGSGVISTPWGTGAGSDTSHTVQAGEDSGTTTVYVYFAGDPTAAHDSFNTAPVKSTTYTVASVGPPPPLAITNVRSESISIDSATIAWATNLPADSLVKYGTSPDNMISVSDPEFVTSHSITLTGLSQDTTYYYKAFSSDGTDTVDSGRLSFNTLLPEALAITTDSLPSGIAGIQYSAGLQASGGVSPYSWSITTGSLPDGLSLNQSGEISGTPTTEETASFTVEVTDSAVPQQSDTRQLSIMVSIVDLDGIVDNADPGQFTVAGTWSTAPPPDITGYYGDDLRYHAGGGIGVNTATWDAELPAGSGLYEVYVWYIAAKVLATDAPYTINYADGTTTVRVNQQVKGSQWVKIGTFNFADDGTENVILSDDTSIQGQDVSSSSMRRRPPPPPPTPTTWVVADAVRFKPVVPDGIVDNADPGQFSVVGTWGTAPPHPHSITGYYGDDLRYHRGGGTGANTATWDVELLDGPGTYEVYVWYVAAKALATDAPYTINYADGSTTVRVNQQAKGSQWVSLGTFKFADTGGENVTLSDDANGWVIADAVRFAGADTGGESKIDYELAAGSIIGFEGSTNPNPVTGDLTIDLLNNSGAFNFLVSIEGIGTEKVTGTIDVDLTDITVDQNDIILSLEGTSTITNSYQNIIPEGTYTVTADITEKYEGVLPNVTSLVIDMILSPDELLTPPIVAHLVANAKQPVPLIGYGLQQGSIISLEGSNQPNPVGGGLEIDLENNRGAFDFTVYIGEINANDTVTGTIGEISLTGITINGQDIVVSLTGTSTVTDSYSGLIPEDTYQFSAELTTTFADFLLLPGYFVIDMTLSSDQLPVTPIVAHLIVELTSL